MEEYKTADCINITILELLITQEISVGLRSRTVGQYL